MFFLYRFTVKQSSSLFLFYNSKSIDRERKKLPSYPLHFPQPLRLHLHHLGRRQLVQSHHLRCRPAHTNITRMILSAYQVGGLNALILYTHNMWQTCTKLHKEHFLSEILASTMHQNIAQFNSAPGFTYFYLYRVYRRLVLGVHEHHVDSLDTPLQWRNFTFWAPGKNS